MAARDASRNDLNTIVLEINTLEPKRWPFAENRCHSRQTELKPFNSLGTEQQVRRTAKSVGGLRRRRQENPRRHSHQGVEVPADKATARAAQDSFDIPGTKLKKQSKG